MKRALLLALLTLAGCTVVDVRKPDGTRIYGWSFCQDMAIGKLTFAKGPSTRPGGGQQETFTMEGYDQKARLEAINKALDLLGAMP